MWRAFLQFTKPYCFITTFIDSPLLTAHIRALAIPEPFGLGSIQGAFSATGELLWTKSMQGNALGAFFWGYLVSQVLGGWASKLTGTRRVFGYTVLLGCIATFLTPFCAKLHYWAFFALRVLLGVFQGVTYPSITTLWTRWAPPTERSILSGISYAGEEGLDIWGRQKKSLGSTGTSNIGVMTPTDDFRQVANIITPSLAGFLCERGFAGGWPSLFYIQGCASFIFFLVWMIFASDSPEKHNSISLREKHYIEQSLEAYTGNKQLNDVSIRIPWMSIWTSKAVWALFTAHWASDWGAYFILTSLPSFMSDVLGFEWSVVGFVTSIPYITYVIGINASGFLADMLLQRKCCSVATVRKIMQTIALLSLAAAQVAAGYATCGQQVLVIFLLALGTGLSGFQYAGFIVNYIDIAPPFAGTIFGIGNTLSCIAGILAPFAMGALTPTKSRMEWQILFWINAVISIFGAVIFCVLGSGEVQSWAKTKDENRKEAFELSNQAHNN